MKIMKTKKKPKKVETRWVVETHVQYTFSNAQRVFPDIGEAMDYLDTLTKNGIPSSEIALYKAVLQPVEW
jgi:hypothetical protein